eukprot:1161531-Pelagomonas_calceolata.AAC.10
MLAGYRVKWMSRHTRWSKQILPDKVVSGARDEPDRNPQGRCIVTEPFHDLKGRPAETMLLDLISRQHWAAQGEHELRRQHARASQQYCFYVSSILNQSSLGSKSTGANILHNFLWLLASCPNSSHVLINKGLHVLFTPFLHKLNAIMHKSVAHPSKAPCPTISFYAQIQNCSRQSPVSRLSAIAHSLKGSTCICLPQREHQPIHLLLELSYCPPNNDSKCSSSVP